MDIGRFFSTVTKSKAVKRAGWVERGVNDPETVSSHSFMSALLSMFLTPEGIDRDRVIRMMLVHDVAESVTGDMITKENWEEGGTITKAEKAKLERKAVHDIASSLGDAGNELLSLWEEFEACSTPESRFANDMDVFERTMQAMDYHMKGNAKKLLKPFWESKNMEKIADKRLKNILTEIIDTMGR